MTFEDQWKELGKMETDHIKRMAKLRDGCAAFDLLAGLVGNAFISFTVCKYLHPAVITSGSIGMVGVTCIVIKEMLFYQRDHQRIVKEALDRRQRHLAQAGVCKELGI